MGIVVVRVHGQQLVRPCRCLFCESKRDHVALFDQRGVISLQSGRERHCEQSILIVGIVSQSRLRQRLGSCQGGIESFSYFRIGR